MYLKSHETHRGYMIPGSGIIVIHNFYQRFQCKHCDHGTWARITCVTADTDQRHDIVHVNYAKTLEEFQYITVQRHQGLELFEEKDVGDLWNLVDGNGNLVGLGTELPRKEDKDA